MGTPVDPPPNFETMRRMITVLLSPHAPIHDYDAPLFPNGWPTDCELLEFILAFEETLGFEFEDDDFNETTSVNSLAAAALRKLG